MLASLNSSFCSCRHNLFLKEVGRVLDSVFDWNEFLNSVFLDLNVVIKVSSNFEWNFFNSGLSLVLDKSWPKSISESSILI